VRKAGKFHTVFYSMMLYVQIGSDGMNSAVRKAGKFHTVSFNYDQKAVVAVLKIDEVAFLDSFLFNIVLLI